MEIALKLRKHEIELDVNISYIEPEYYKGVKATDGYFEILPYHAILIVRQKKRTINHKVLYENHKEQIDNAVYNEIEWNINNI